MSSTWRVPNNLSQISRKKHPKTCVNKMHYVNWWSWLRRCVLTVSLHKRQSLLFSLAQSPSPVHTMVGSSFEACDGWETISNRVYCFIVYCTWKNALPFARPQTVKARMENVFNWSRILRWQLFRDVSCVGGMYVCLCVGGRREGVIEWTSWPSLIEYLYVYVTRNRRSRLSLVNTCKILVNTKNMCWCIFDLHGCI